MNKTRRVTRCREQSTHLASEMHFHHLLILQYFIRAKHTSHRTLRDGRLFPFWRIICRQSFRILLLSQAVYRILENGF